MKTSALKRLRIGVLSWPRDYPTAQRGTRFRIGSREENASKQQSRASLLIQSEAKMLCVVAAYFVT
jgi:hypothetical protein